MNLGQLSVRQPIFAIVLSIVTIIIGGIAYLTLPVTEYPDVVPPTVVVSTSYPGEEARLRYGQLLKRLERFPDARRVFTDMLKRAKVAPGYYRRKEKSFLDSAKR